MVSSFLVARRADIILHVFSLSRNVQITVNTTTDSFLEHPITLYLSSSKECSASYCVTAYGSQKTDTAFSNVILCFFLLIFLFQYPIQIVLLLTVFQSYPIFVPFIILYILYIILYNIIQYNIIQSKYIYNHSSISIFLLSLCLS